MATLIRMPEVAANTDAATIVSWTRQEGDAVAPGDCLAEIETEKAVIEFNAEQAGVLGRILVQAGKEIEVGAPIAVLLDQGEKGRHESSMAKVLCSEAEWRVVDRCVQILGGSGVTDETIVARIFRDMRAFRIYDGPSEVHRWSIGNRIARG